MIKLRQIKQLNNKCNIIELNDVDLIFSYNSLIGLYYNNNLILDSYYKNYSVTTNKHISFIKQYYYLNNESNIINLKGDSFDLIVNNNFNKNYIESAIKINKESYYIYQYIKEFKDQIKYKNINANNFNESLINLKQHINILTNKDLKIIKDSYKELKTVDHLILTYKIHNITFNIIKSFNKKDKKLKSIQLNNIKVDPINL